MKSSPSSSLPSDKPFEKLNCQPHFRPRLAPHFLNSLGHYTSSSPSCVEQAGGCGPPCSPRLYTRSFLRLNLKPGWTSGNRSVKDCHERYSTGKCVRNAPWESLSLSPPSCTRSSRKTYFECVQQPPFPPTLLPPKKEKKERKKMKMMGSKVT